jgi:putative ABC transport system substrate-binding protein
MAARTQQPAVPVIGFLSSASAQPYASRVRAFLAGLREAGYVEGQNVAIEYRWAEGKFDRLREMANDLVERRVSLIIANTQAAVAAKAATSTIPVIFQSAADPVDLGLVVSLTRPGGNLTGTTSLNVEVAPKLLELMHEVVPTATIAALVNPTNLIAETRSRQFRDAAHDLNLQPLILHASSEGEFDAAFASLVRHHPAALVIASEPFFNSQRATIAALALRHQVPTISQDREFADAGGLMGYGGSLTDNYRTIAGYAGRILKGEKPADLPVQQSTKVELIINLKTAKALGLTVPLSLLGRADEVIE